LEKEKWMEEQIAEMMRNSLEYRRLYELGNPDMLHNSEVARLQAQTMQLELDNMRTKKGDSALKALLNRSDSGLAIGQFAGMGNMAWRTPEALETNQKLDVLHKDLQDIKRSNVTLPKF
jgi:hypothetical protein